MQLHCCCACIHVGAAALCAFIARVLSYGCLSTLPCALQLQMYVSAAVFVQRWQHLLARWSKVALRAA